MNASASFASASTSSPFDYLQQTPPRPASPALSLAAGIAIIYLLLLYFNDSFPPPQQLLWDTLVYLIPQRILLHRAQRQELQAKGMLAHTHAAKKEALRGMLGLGGSALLSKLPSRASEGIDIMRRASTTIFSRPRIHSDLPPGLGNWDNSCYQNVVLQGLASLASLKPYLDRFSAVNTTETTSVALLETVRKLNDAANNGQQLWTPAKLKSMSSWQQQDAQEYYSKILDEIDKETSAAQRTTSTSQLPGLESLVDASDQDTTILAPKEALPSNKSPLDGLLAQKVTCTRCGFSEGLSMIPFNCLTLPLPADAPITDLQQCLDEYTKLEEISEVECAKCTLLHAEQQLTKMLPSNPGFQSTESSPSPPGIESKTLQLPPELRVQAFKRLAAIQAALEKDDFADRTLQESCQLGKKARVSTTKTKSACIARRPECLVVHVNRSVFDEQTGMQRKNYARVQYPLTLDLAPWTLDDARSETGQEEEEESELYRLKAVVTHYGRHENGHYICYRQHPVRRKMLEVIEDEDGGDMTDGEEVLPSNDDPWYKLSDEDVSPVAEEDVLGQGGVFMLFYERETVPEASLAGAEAPVIEAEAVETMQIDVHVQEDDDAAPISNEAIPGSTTHMETESASTETPLLIPEMATPATYPSSPERANTDSTSSLLPNEISHEQEQAERRHSGSTSPLLRMRTARIPVAENEFAGSAFRVVAAT